MNSLVNKSRPAPLPDFLRYQLPSQGVRYESCQNLSRNGLIIQYDTPVKRNHARSSYIEQRQNQSDPVRLPSHQTNHTLQQKSPHQRVPHQQSGDHNSSLRNSRQNKNNSNSGGYGHPSSSRSPRQKRPASVQRAKSFSDILSVPRVETAFVGDEALTVYHGFARYALYFT